MGELDQAAITRTFIRCSALDERSRRIAAELAAAALPSLYAGLADETVPMLADEFLVNGGELGPALAMVGSQVDAVVAAYPAEEYALRQQVSLHHALRSLGEPSAAAYIARLRFLSSEIEPGHLVGQYISRFSVRAELRGTGVADLLMHHVIGDDGPISLHVRADNARAIQFYRRHGFSQVGAGDRPTLIMRRG